MSFSDHHVWLICSGALLLADVFLGSCYLAATCIGCCAAALFSCFNYGLEWQFPAFAVVTLVSCMTVRYLKRRGFDTEADLQNPDIGKCVMVDDWTPQGTAF
ncbi:MAG: hypothetical protein Q4E62_06960, partial [Sutterellaceae bacterium]|nr:hypothetical protein [Sutterellaceae bacterium]